jgi:serine/threonine protein kinase
MKFEPGSKIGDYEVLGQLGAGGMGRVYKVRNELSDRVEAMKVLLPDLEGHKDLATRFLREIKVQAGMDHPNIAKLYTALRIENQLLMCMEMVDGVALDQRLREGPIALIDAIDYIVQVLSALDYAHQRGVVHRDIKPANMMLLSDGKIKLLDFGIAKATDNRLTVTGTTLGSLYYMSPEQIQGGQVDVRSDVYSVGVSLYELVTGKKPFDAESQFAIMSAHLARTPMPPIELNPNLPRSVSDTILMALNKEPGTRFQTAAEFLEALRSVQEEVGYGTATLIAASTAPRTNLRTSIAPVPAPVPPLGDSLRMTAMQPTIPAAAPSRPVASATEVESNGGSKRMIWVAVGCLGVVGAIVAFTQFGSKKKGSNEQTPFTVSEPQAPYPQKGAPPTAKPSAAGAAVSKDTRKQPATPQRPDTRAVAPPAATPAAPQPARTPEPAPQGTPVQAGSVQDAINKNRVEVHRLSDQLDAVFARAKIIRGELQTRGDLAKPEWVESFNRLNRFLKQASAAINDGNAAGGTEALSNAAVELDGLEKALGK